MWPRFCRDLYEVEAADLEGLDSPSPSSGGVGVGGIVGPRRVCSSGTPGKARMRRIWVGMTTKTTARHHDIDIILKK
jgi:hypothetical protein